MRQVLKEAFLVPRTHAPICLGNWGTDQLLGSGRRQDHGGAEERD
jgi:hypothetical protein